MIDLTRFCGINDDRVWMRAPFSLEGLDGTHATNGTTLVWQFGPSDRPACTARGQIVETFRNLMHAAKQASIEHPTWVRADSVALRETKCQKCCGLGRFDNCDECDGDGSFHHGSHEYDCKNCSGHGHLPHSFGSNLCAACRGRGLAFSATEPTPFGIRECCLSQRTLGLIQLLPNAEIGSISEERAFFRFDGGVGVAMPMHHEGWSTRFAAPASAVQAGGGV